MSRDVRLLLDVLRSLPAPAAEALVAHARAREYAPGEPLFTEGETAHGLYLVLDGEVRVVRSSRGRRHVLHTERRGGTLGEAPLFDGAPYPATAVAGTAVRALYVDRAALDRALRASPEVAWFFLGRLAGRVRILLDRVDRLATADVGTRLAAYLVEQAERTGGTVVAATQESLAEELGTVREVVARALRVLRARTTIRSAGRGRIELLDLAALRAAGNGGDAP